MPQELKARNEMDKQYQWRLEDIFPSDEAYESAYALAEKSIAATAQRQVKVA